MANRLNLTNRYLLFIKHQFHRFVAMALYFC